MVGEAVERGGLERCVEEFWALEPAGPLRGGRRAFSFVLDSECIPEHTRCELETRGYLALGEERETENAGAGG